MARTSISTLTIALLLITIAASIATSVVLSNGAPEAKGMKVADTWVPRRTMGN